jgi:hypothetical protein
MSVILNRTGCYYTVEEATEISNMWSQGLKRDGSKAPWDPEYNTAMKGEPARADCPLECWYITNEFDPRVEG